jgi:hypothetical protein
MKTWRAVPLPIYAEIALAVLAFVVSVMEKQRSER